MYENLCQQLFVYLREQLHYAFLAYSTITYLKSIIHWEQHTAHPHNFFFFFGKHKCFTHIPTPFNKGKCGIDDVCIYECFTQMEP